MNVEEGISWAYENITTPKNIPSSFGTDFVRSLWEWPKEPDERNIAIFNLQHGQKR